MVGEHDFGARLRRLLDRRRLHPTSLSRLADVPEPELTAVLRAHQTPTPPLLRRLAPALGLHTADVFAIAGADIPEDLAPLDATAGRDVPRVIREAAGLPPEHRGTLRRFVASLPQAQRTRPVPDTPPGRRYPPGARRPPHAHAAQPESQPAGYGPHVRDGHRPLLGGGHLRARWGTAASRSPRTCWRTARRCSTFPPTTSPR